MIRAAAIVAGLAVLAGMFALLVSRAAPWELNSDTLTYLAAGERLNAGHALYALGPGDRPVGLDIPVVEAIPLLSPPFVAVIWRPLALLPDELGRALWWGGAFIAIWAAVAFLLLRVGGRAAIVVAILSWSIAIELITGNVNGYLVAGTTLVWLYRDRPWVGALVGVMTAVKLGPIVLFLFLAGQRNWRSLAVGAAALAVCGAVSLVGAGWDSHLRYIDIALHLPAQDWSLSFLTGITWMTSAVLVGGSALCLATAAKPAVSFRLAVLVMVFGSPAVSGATLALLVALLAPWATERTELPLPSPFKAPRRLDEVAHAPNRGRMGGTNGGE